MFQTIEDVCVVGAGLMGSQIAVQSAAFGKRVRLHDVSDKSLANSRQAIADLANDIVAAGVAGGQCSQSILDRIHYTTSLDEAAAEAQLVIEAITEDVDAKRGLFHQLDDICPPSTVLATNSSSIRISRVESATRRADRVLNTHFVQPVWKHPFVELMRGSVTSDETMATVDAFMKSIGVLPVIVRKESTGFIFNRIWRAVKKEALRVVDQQIATVEDVDRTWMILWETSMGPFALMDNVGLDVVRDIEMVYFEQSGDPSDAPPQLLLDKISRGELGVKTGKGFYTYPNPSWQSPEFLAQR
ncbi:MAG: 3-hydroxyacyl-CoA dehydrogenase family protein [Pirellulaceae bacterium]|jgi:3-hydroxybutyryl-CoA dehydrogenase|nr:3-hydroxyacyl-CoA dehydrogenase family protein [Pirellulaceae bacterium]MDP7018207.1 3-hydroxyacyl-CoA dehydrogenase family protein [Pirellulaceae bacterium]